MCLGLSNYQNFSNVIAQGTKQESKNCKPIKASKSNAVVVFRLWRHDDHAGCRSHSRPPN